MFKKARGTISKNLKRILCVVLTGAMCLSCSAATAFAGTADADAAGAADGWYEVSLGGGAGGSVAFADAEGDSARFAEGDEVSLELVADDGYSLVSVAVNDAEGETVTEGAQEGSRYTFSMPAQDVFVEAEFAESDSADAMPEIAAIHDIETYDVNQSVKNVATVLPSGTGLPSGIKFNLSASNFNYEKSTVNNTNLEIITGDGGYFLCFKSAGNKTVEGDNLATLYYEDVGMVGERSVDATLTFTKVTERNTSSTQTTGRWGTGTGDTIFEVTNGWFHGDFGVKEISYEVKITYSDDGSLVEVPSWLAIDDLDTRDTGLDYHESITMDKTKYDAFYVWDQCYLDASQSGNMVTFSAPTSGDNTDGNDQWYVSGLVATKSNADFEATTVVANGCGNQLNVYSILPENPVKTVTDEQTAYQVGDTVKFTVTQQMPKYLEETYEYYEDMEIYDVLPDGLTMTDAQVSAATMTGSSDGTLSSGSGKAGNFTYSTNTDGTSTLKFTFDKTWLETSSHYGQTLTMTFEATVTGEYADGSTTILNNTAYTDIGEATYDSNTVSITVVDPKLYIFKKRSPNMVDVGGTVTYTITLSEKTKNATAHNVVISDTLPDNLSLQDVSSSSGTVTINGNMFTVSCGDMTDTSSEITVTVTATVVSYPSSGYIDNTATATDDEDDNVSSTTRITPYVAALDGTKTTEQDQYYVGDDIHYTITLTTAGVVDNPTISDTLPSNVEFVSLDHIYCQGMDWITDYTNGYSFSQSGNNLTISFHDYIDPSATIEYTCRAITEGLDAVNSAGVSYSGGGFYLYAPIDIVEIEPALQISKSADGTEYYPGDTVDYTITVKQTVEGATAKEVMIEDVLPAGLTSLKKTTLTGVDGTVYDGQSLSVYIPELAYGETATVKVKASVDSGSYVGATITNTASAYASNASEVTDSAAITTVRPDPALSIQKQADQTEYNLDDTVTYTISVDQTVDDAIAEDVTISDTLPSQTELKGVTTTRGTASTDGNSFKVEIPQLSRSESATVKVTATAVSEGTNIDNTGKADATNAREVTDNAIITLAAEDEASPALSISKTAGSLNYKVGDTVTYTIVVDQTVEDVEATNVVVSDTLPSGLTLKDVTTTGGGTVSKSGNGFTVTYASLAYNTPQTITVTATADQSSASLTNTATAKADNADEVSASAPIAIAEIDPALSITKEADGSTYDIGDTVNYTIHVAQTVEGATSKNVVVTDALPSGLTVTGTPTATNGGTVSVSGNTVTVTYAELAYGADATITIPAQITDSALAGQSVLNTASAVDDAGNNVNDTAQISVSEPNIEIIKTADKSTYAAGDTVTYEITVRETREGATSTGVVVTDTLSDAFTVSSISASISGVSGTCGLNGSTLTVTIPTLTYGETATITVTAVIDPNYLGTTIQNTAHVTDDYGNTSLDSVTVDVIKPNISIIKTADHTLYNVGDTVTYTISVENTVSGTIDRSVVVTDTLPEGLTIVGTPQISGAAGSAVTNGNTITATITELAYGTTATITVEATVGASLVGATAVNEASVTDLYGNAEKAEATINVREPDIEITKSVDPDTCAPGDTITYTIHVKETVPDAVTSDVVITDTLHSALSVTGGITVDGVSGSVVTDGNTFTVTIPTLEYGEEATITVTAQIADDYTGSSISNTAYAEDTYGNHDNDTATVEVITPNISIEKTADKTSYNVGDTATYTIVVKNTVRDTTDRDVVVTDTLPEGLTLDGTPDLVGVSGRVVKDSDRDFTVTIDELAYGDTATITVKATVGASLVGQTVVNEAYVTDTYGNSVNDSATIQVLMPGLHITKDASSGTYAPGDTITYTINVNETLTGAATKDVVVTDKLDDALTLESVSVAGLAESNYTITKDSDNKGFTVDIGTLASTELAVITVTAKIDEDYLGSTISNTVHVTDAYGNTADSEEIVDVIQPTVTIKKQADHTSYNVGDTVTYTITVEDKKNDTTDRSVEVSDTLPEGLTLVNVTSDQGGVVATDKDSNSFTVTYAELEANVTATITVTATVESSAAGGTLTNTAYVEDLYGNSAESSAQINVTKPGLDVTKTATSATYAPGDTITYTINVNETLTGAATKDVVVTDTLVSDLTLVDVTVAGLDPDNYEIIKNSDGSGFTVNIGTLASTELAVITVTAKIDENYLGSTISNTVHVTDAYGNTVNDEETVSVITPDISIDKQADGHSYNVGDTVTYTILVENTKRNTTDREVVVTDALPDGLTLISATSKEGEVRVSDNTFTAAFAELAYGDTATIMVTATVGSSLAGETVTNEASVVDLYGNHDNDTAEIAVAMPGISIKKSADASTYQAGDTITYTLLVKETVKDSVTEDVIVTDTLASDLTLQSVTVSGVDAEEPVINGNTFAVTIPTLRYGEDATITVTAVIDPTFSGSIISNEAYVGDTHGNTDDDDVTVNVLSPTLSITKVANHDIYSVGDTVTYTLTIQNTEKNTTARNVVVTDTLPDGLTSTGKGTFTGVDGTFTTDGQNITVDIPALPYGEKAVVTIYATVGHEIVGQTVMNVAVATDENGDKVDDEVPIEVYQPELSIVKEADEAVYSLGDTVTYTIHVEQLTQGTSAKNVVVSDTLPSELELVSVEAKDCTVEIDGNGFTVTRDELSGSMDITVTATAIAAGEDVSNIAYASAEDTPDVFDTATADILEPVLQVTKTADQYAYYVGDTITYDIEVCQTQEDVTAKDVVITDTLPDGLELIGTPVVHTTRFMDGASVSVDGNSFTVKLDKLAYGEVVTITVEARALEAAANTTVRNVAVATASNTDEEYQDEEYADILKPILAITKDADATDYGIDDIVTYTITVAQTVEGLTAENVVVTDTLPKQLELMDVTAEGGSVIQDDYSFTVKYDELAYGEVQTITVTARAVDDKEGIVNTAVADADHADEVTDTATITVRRPVLSVSKVADSTTYSQTDLVTYTIEVQQLVAGLTAKNVVVTDTVPSELELVDVTADNDGTVSQHGNDITVKFDSLPYGTTAKITVTAIANGEGELITNTAVANADFAAEVSDYTDIIVRRPEITISKAVDVQTAYPGDEVTYTLTVTNVREAPNAYHVVVSDTIPEGLTLKEVVAEGGDVAYDADNANSFTVTYDVIPYNESRVITATAVVEESAANTTVQNIAVAEADNADPVEDTVEFDAIKPILSITKEADKEEYSVDGEVNYTITAKQTVEGLTAENVVITDTLPENMELSEATLTGVDGEVTTEDGTITVTIPALGYGQTAVVQISAIAIAEGEDITNTATVTADHADPEEDEVTVTVLQPELSITKDVDYHDHFVNDTVTYTITVTEDVPDAEAYGVEVYDPLPEGIHLVDVQTVGLKGDVSIDGDTFTVEYDTVGYEDEVQIIVTAIAGEEDANKIEDNVAYVRALNIPRELEDDAEIYVMEPELLVTKTADAEEYFVGDKVTYTITVEQIMENDVDYNVVVTDEIPEGLDIKSVKLEGVDGEVSLVTNMLTVKIPVLTYGDTAVITITAIVEDGYEGMTIANTANARGDHSDPASDEADLDVLDPVLSVTKTADAESYCVGDTVTYTIEAEEVTEGVTETNVVITDELPDGMTLQGTPEITIVRTEETDTEEAEPEIRVSGNGFVATIPTLSYGEKAIITVVATLDEASDAAVNTAYVDGEHSVPTEDSSEVEVKAPELAIEKTVDAGTHGVGDTVTYNIRVWQTVEGATDTNVMVHDRLPDGLTLEGEPELTGVEGTVTVFGHEVIAQIPTLTYGEEALITITATVDDLEKKIENVAYAVGDLTEGVRDVAEFETVEPKLSIVKTADKSEYEIGDTAEYTIRVTQTVRGATDRDVEVTDDLPDALELVGTPTLRGVDGTVTVLDNGLRVDIPTLTYGEEAVITVRATVNEYLNGGHLTNTAYARGEYSPIVSDNAKSTVKEPEETGITGLSNGSDGSGGTAGSGGSGGSGSSTGSTSGAKTGDVTPFCLGILVLAALAVVTVLMRRRCRWMAS